MIQSEEPRVDVLGVGLSVLNLSQAADSLFPFVKKRGCFGFVTVTGVHGVTESLSDPELRKIHNESFLSTPDGMPMVWAGQLAGYCQMGRVYGPDLMLKVTEEGIARDVSHFYFGGNTDVADELKVSLSKRFEGLSVVGTYTPPFRPLTVEEERELLDEIIRTQPHFFWVGLSTPKQEKFMHGFLSRYEAELSEGLSHGMLMLGVGAAFDFHSGKVRQAPSWMQTSGLEWLFRAITEPRRLLMRYVKGNSKFLWHVLLSRLGFRKY